MADYEGSLYEDTSLTQEDFWVVISSFFSEKTLVSQQIASFNEFVTNTMQELVDENATLILDQNPQYTGKDSEETKRYKIKFGQIYLSRRPRSRRTGLSRPCSPTRLGCATSPTRPRSR